MVYDLRQDFDVFCAVFLFFLIQWRVHILADEHTTLLIVKDKVLKAEFKFDYLIFPIERNHVRPHNLRRLKDFFRVLEDVLQWVLFTAAV